MSRRVLVVGLRTTGDSVVRHCTARGDVVTVVEEDPGRRGYDARVAAARASGARVVEEPDPAAWPALVAEADLVVPSPGVRPVHPVFAAARAAGVPLRGDVDLGLELATVPVVAVTGTNGKTTVATLVTAMLRQSGVRAVVAGNIGRALLDVLAEPSDVIVAEVSSFQLYTTTAAFRPRVAVLLNLAEDHLDWHGSFAEYAATKARLFAHQQGEDLLVFNADDPKVAALAARAPAARVGFTLAGPAPGAYALTDGVLVAPDGAPIAPVGELATRAPHDAANALAAAAAARALGASDAGVRGTLGRFRRLHHRVELVGKADGVEFYDDSKATNPHATLSALSGFDRVVLLAGGDSKGVDLAALRVAADRLRAVVAIGATPDEVEVAFAGSVPTRRAGTMREAVRVAAGLAEPGDAVLLSPSCASFDWYEGYEQRGDDFAHEVANLLAEHGA